MSLRLAMGGGPRDDERAGIVASALDHLVERIVLNADSPHAGRIFLDACEHEGTLMMEVPGIGDAFLDRLLPALDELDRLPPNLVPFMIREFGWPETLGEAGATPLRPDVRALIERHAREAWVIDDAGALVDKASDRLRSRHALLGAVLAVVILLVIICGKLLYRWGQWSSSV